MLNGLRTRRDFRAIFLHNSARVFNFGFRTFLVPFNLAFPKWSSRSVRKSLVNLVEGTFLVAGTRIEHEDFHSSVRPLPVLHLRHIITVLACILFVLHQFASQELSKVGTYALQLWNPIHHVSRKVKAIQVIHDGHVERSGCSTLFFVAVHMEVVVTMSAIAQPMDEPWISV